MNAEEDVYRRLQRHLGHARLISREEFLERLVRAEKPGPVLQPQNTQSPGFVCCCSDCCEMLISARKLPRPAEYFVTNFQARVDDERLHRVRALRHDPRGEGHPPVPPGAGGRAGAQLRSHVSEDTDGALRPAADDRQGCPPRDGRADTGF